MATPFIVPDGWRLVPEEPTPRMVAASQAEMQRYRDSFTAEQFAAKARQRGEHFNIWVTPFEKHLMRLRAALSVAPKFALAETFDEYLARKRAARLGRVDKLPPDQRAIVHDYGLTVFDSLQGAGITKAPVMRHIVETVLNELSPARRSNSVQGPGTPLNSTLREDAA